MATRDELLAAGLRYDPHARRQSRRHGNMRGVRVEIPKAALIAAGIDPDADPPEYSISTSATNPGAILLRFYR